MADVNRSVSVGPATAQMTATSPAVMSVMSTQPGTSPRSSNRAAARPRLFQFVIFPLLWLRATPRAQPLSRPEPDRHEPRVHREDHGHREDQEHDRDEHRDL